MNMRSIMLLAAATLLAGSWYAGDLVRAFPASGATAPAEAAVPYQWQGAFGPRLLVSDAYVPDCPLRKLWVETDAGPRLKWRRACPVRN